MLMQDDEICKRGDRKVLQYLRESVDLFSVSKTKKEINKWIAYYGVKVKPMVSPEGHAYQVVEGEYSKVVGFLGEVFDMNVMDVISNVGDDVWWCRCDGEEIQSI